MLASLLGASGVPAIAAVTVDFDKTVLFMAVLFLVLAFVLKPLLFDPVLRIFEEREKRTDGAKTEARQMQEKAGDLLRRYEKELENVNRVAAEERDKARAETAKLEAEILGEARAATLRIVDEGRARIEEELVAIKFDLGRESERIAQQIAERVIGGRSS